MQNCRSSKVMTTKEAISRFVHDGDSVITGNYTEGLPFSLIFEIIRQKRSGLYITASPARPMSNSWLPAIASKNCVPPFSTSGAAGRQAAWWNDTRRRESFKSRITAIHI